MTDCAPHVHPSVRCSHHACLPKHVTAEDTGENQSRQIDVSERMSHNHSHSAAAQLPQTHPLLRQVLDLIHCILVAEGIKHSENSGNFTYTKARPSTQYDAHVPMVHRVAVAVCSSGSQARLHGKHGKSCQLDHPNRISTNYNFAIKLAGS